MKSNEKVELINQTLQKLIQEKKKKKASSHDDQLLLSTLLSQLESLKEEEEEEEEEEEVGEQSNECETTQAEETEGEDADQINGGGGVGAEIGAEEIVKEIKKVKKQNLITHCLLSVMIVLTFAWQFSEVALIFKVKDGLSHPFRSVGSILTGILKPPQLKPLQNIGDNSEKEQQQHHHIEALILPELPHVHVDFSELHLNGEKH
ncbi:hypothetical protein Dsin_010699 [Dipteronia sinensis]|uniref:Uncharacterized protein n=1 Tax=Dipteronia sinensis TaxID=43782 RepID=A0AAE0ED34_9ROSI|nr:hypothetical protein Dsin_010699 [Dipteronia sinensis]